MTQERTREVQKAMDGMAVKNRELSFLVDALPELAENMAQTERDFNVLFSQKLFSLKADGMAIGLAKEMAKGDKTVADTLFKFRLAEAIYDAQKKKIYSLNVAIDTYRSLLSWYKQEYSQGA